LAIWSKVTLLLAVAWKPRGALRPDFVVMMMAPAAAREPYSAAAAGPLRTEMLSMSSVFRSWTALP